MKGRNERVKFSVSNIQTGRQLEWLDRGCGQCRGFWAYYMSRRSQRLAAGFGFRVVKGFSLRQVDEWMAHDVVELTE